MIFALSVIYISAEAIFNMKLLEVAGSVRSDPEAIDHLQYFGRSVSAYGFTLLTLGIFQGMGFRLTTRRHWGIFFGLSFICLLPFISVFSQSLRVVSPNEYKTPLPLEPLDVMTSIMPCLGFLMAITSAGRYRPQIFIALILLAWPAMFLGQKLVIERYVIDKTDWAERSDARYMLMLRAGLEDCALHLGDLQLCDDEYGAPDMKATRIIVSAMWMMHPDAVLQDLKDNREALVESAAVRGVWFSPSEKYKEYVGKVEEGRDAYAQGMMAKFTGKYYEPYARASEMYKKALSAEEVSKEADGAIADINQQMDDGWKKYQLAVRDFKQNVSLAAGAALRQTMTYASRVNRICDRRGDCPDLDMGDALDDAQQKAAHQFTVKSGYPPDITDKQVFLNDPHTQKLVREEVQDNIRMKFGIKDFALPADWTYDPKSFKVTLSDLIRDQAKGKWHEKFGDRLPPGLNEDQFMAALGIDPSVPSIDKLVMSEDDFFKKYILPGNQKLIDGIIQELSEDRRRFADDTVDTEEGKDYVKALYLPTISLVVSLGVVMLTLFRGLMVLPDALIRSGRLKVNASPMSIRLGLAGAFLSALMFLPLLVPNPYASGDTYHRYLSAARQNHPVIASLLNWAVQIQPVIYRAGDSLRHAFK